MHRDILHIFIPNIKSPCSNLWLGRLCTDADANDANDTDGADGNHVLRANHDFLGLFCIIPNEPKIQRIGSFGL